MLSKTNKQWGYFGGDMYSLAYQVDVLWWRYALHLLYFGGDMYLLACQVAVFRWSYLPTHMSGGCTLVEICTYSHVRWMHFGGVIYLITRHVDVLWWSYVPACTSGELV